MVGGLPWVSIEISGPVGVRQISGGLTMLSEQGMTKRARLLFSPHQTFDTKKNWCGYYYKKKDEADPMKDLLRLIFPIRKSVKRITQGRTNLYSKG